MGDEYGYYKCPSCGNEMISNFPFVECRCMSCNNSIIREKKISYSQYRKLMKAWESNE